MLGFFASLFVIIATQRSIVSRGVQRVGVANSVFCFPSCWSASRFYIRLRMKRGRPIFSAIKGAGKDLAQSTEGSPSAGWKQHPPAAHYSVRRYGSARRAFAYSAELYSLFYLQTILKVESADGPASSLAAASAALGFPRSFSSAAPFRPRGP